MIAIYLVLSFIILGFGGVFINDQDEPQLSYMMGLLSGAMFVWCGQFIGVF